MAVVAPCPNRTVRFQGRYKVVSSHHLRDRHTVGVLDHHLELAKVNGTHILPNRDSRFHIGLQIIRRGDQIGVIIKCGLHHGSLYLHHILIRAGVGKLHVIRIPGLAGHIVSPGPVPLADVEANIIIPVDPFLIYTDKLVIGNGQYIGQLFLQQIQRRWVCLHKQARNAGVPLSQRNADRHTGLFVHLVGVDPDLIHDQPLRVRCARQHRGRTAVRAQLLPGGGVQGTQHTTAVAAHAPDRAVLKPEQSPAAAGGRANDLYSKGISNICQHAAIRRRGSIDDFGYIAALLITLGGNFTALAHLVGNVTAPSIGHTVRSHRHRMVEAHAQRNYILSQLRHLYLVREVRVYILSNTQASVNARAPTINRSGQANTGSRGDHVGMALMIDGAIGAYAGHSLTASCNVDRGARHFSRVAGGPDLHRDRGHGRHAFRQLGAQLAAAVLAPAIHGSILGQSHHKGTAGGDLNDPLADPSHQVGIPQALSGAGRALSQLSAVIASPCVDVAILVQRQRETSACGDRYDVP